MNTDEKTDRQNILDAVAEYYSKYISSNSEFVEGDRIPYAARVFDEKEMCALVDSALDFWLTLQFWTKPANTSGRKVPLQQKLFKQHQRVQKNKIKEEFL